MKIVIVEWDGRQPSTTYYNGLHKLGLRVRGANKDEAPIIRRSSRSDHSVIVQEGAVLVESESLARQVAYLASYCGARSVFVGDCVLDEEQSSHQMTPAEIEVVNRFNRAFKTRGRPESGSNDVRVWVVTCPECASTSITTSSKVVIQCPECGGLRVSTRVGDFHNFDHLPSSLDEWVKMHFVEGEFEIPTFTHSKTCEQVGEVKLSQKDEEVIGLMSESKMVKDIISRLPSKFAEDILNDIFVSRRYFTKQDRQHPRTKMVVDLLERGVAPSLIPLFESDVDVLDASIIPSDESLIRQFYLSL